MFRTLLTLALGATLDLITPGIMLAQPAHGETFQDCQTCPDMIVIPSGSYIKGSPPGEVKKPARLIAMPAMKPRKKTYPSPPPLPFQSMK